MQNKVDNHQGTTLKELVEYLGTRIAYITSNYPERDTVATVRTGGPIGPAYWEKFFPDDVIRAAIPFMANAGYHVWHYVDYKGNDDYWLTRTGACPNELYTLVS